LQEGWSPEEIGLVVTTGGYAGAIAIRGDEYFGSKADLMTTITAKSVSDALSKSHKRSAFPGFLMAGDWRPPNLVKQTDGYQSRASS
jgi:hypothetical protein